MKHLQVASANDEIEASITKGYLENLGIKSKIISINNNLPSRYSMVTNRPFGIYVEETKAEEAKKILKERNT